MKLIISIIIHIVLLPVIMVGFVMVGYRQIQGSKKHGLSGTAIDVLQTRWIQHYFGGRSDPVTIALSKTLPNMSHLGMWLGMSGIAAAHRLLGYLPRSFSSAPKGEESLMNFLFNRHLFFDDVFERNIPNVEQAVLMGSGFDTRAFTYCHREGLTVFELDQPNMQRVKRKALEESGLDSGFIHFVPVDFVEQVWHEELQAAGFDGGKKTLFLWEGVTPYLTESDVRATLRKVAEFSAPGSILALDLYSVSFVERASKVGGRVYENTTGETFSFSVDLTGDGAGVVESLLQSEGLESINIDLVGVKRSDKEPICAFVEAQARLA